MSDIDILEQRRQARSDKAMTDADLLRLHVIAADALCSSSADTVRACALIQVDKWERDALCNFRYVVLWRDILRLSGAALREAILRDDAEGIALRQNSPFGFLKGEIRSFPVWPVD